MSISSGAAGLAFDDDPQQPPQPQRKSSGGNTTPYGDEHPSTAPPRSRGSSDGDLHGGGQPRRVTGKVVLQMKEVTKQFQIQGSDQIVTALKDISLYDDDASSPTRRKDYHYAAVHEGDFVMIRGPSGGGKTTMLNLIGTLDQPSAGTVELMGQIIDKDSTDDFLANLRLKHIGFVFQTFNLLSTMSALENVELPMSLLGELNEKERRSRAKQLLALVGLRNRIHHLPSELSGGEQQRVTIARALANNPSILLLDEPTGDLDTATTIEIMDLLAKINTLAGTTCIMVTHNPDVECYAHRILYVSDGKFACEVTNEVPVPLIREEYEKYLKEIESQKTGGMIHQENAMGHVTRPLGDEKQHQEPTAVVGPLSGKASSSSASASSAAPPSVAAKTSSVAADDPMI